MAQSGGGDIEEMQRQTGRSFFQITPIGGSALILSNGVLSVNAGELAQGVIIGPDPNNRPLRRVDFEKGKQSLTLFVLIKAEEGRSRLRLKPITGRSHQLRIHLMAIGHPILGCDLYAHPSALSASERLCLHAKSLVLEHPSSKKKVEFFSQVPF